MTKQSNAQITELGVDLGARSYPIYIGEKLLNDAAGYLDKHLESKRAIIITDENVGRYYLHRLTGALATAEINTASFILPPGEATKSFEQMQGLLDKIFAQAPDRKTAIIALGGGVVGDISGVAASLALRGLPFIQIPTSLLAQVDSSVGGKTGINSSFGKNTIGSFYQPKAVMIDTTTLQTLPKRELLAGYAEIIKYGLIYDREFFDWLLEHGENIIDGDAEALNYAIFVSCKTKAAIVAMDELEQSGTRAWLNFGHTYAHAFEAELGYGDTLLHGEAVAIGMVMALKLSARLGHADATLADTLEKHLAALGLRTCPKQVQDVWNIDALMAHLAHDKKAEAGKLTFVLLKEIGNVFVEKNVPESTVYDVLAEELS